MCADHKPGDADADQGRSAGVPDPDRSPLATLSYRSRAATPLSRDQLQSLLAQARARNQASGITGMLLYDGVRFFQWLEGPRESVSAVWRSIRSDPRHDHIEILAEATTHARLFAGWDMQLFCRERAGDPADAGGGSAAEQVVTRLVQLALAGDGDAVTGFLEERMRAGDDMPTLCRDLVEPAARRLGDWRSQERCGDVDVTLALCDLQMAVRRLGAAPASAADPIGGSERAILIASHPAEPNILGTILVGDVFRRAGWIVEVDFPRSDPQLVERVRVGWYDVVDLLLSDVASRPDRLDAVAASIRAVRAGSLNRRVVVIVGGRVFVDRPDTAAAIVGADAACASAVDALAKATSRLGLRAPPCPARPPDATGRGRPPSAPPALPEALPPGWFWVR